MVVPLHMLCGCDNCYGIRKREYTQADLDAAVATAVAAEREFFIDLVNDAVGCGCGGVPYCEACEKTPLPGIRVAVAARGEK